MNNEPHGFALIDRLATGDLRDDARRELFGWLDREPSRWRRCALALLESRELEQAFAEWGGSDSRPAAPLESHRTMARWRRSELFALAASVMIAFSLGAFARGFWTAPAPMIVAASQPVAPRTENQAEVHHPKSSPDVIQQTTRPAEKAVAAASTNDDPIPPYVRSQWERHGYKVKAQQVKLPAVLPDGQRLTVPANEVQFNYVGQRTY